MYTSVSIQDGIEYLPSFFSDIYKYFDTEESIAAVKDAFEKKIDLIKTGKIEGRLILKDNSPVGFGWVELTAPAYGNMMLHCYDDETAAKLAEDFVDQKLVKGRLLELVQFKSTTPYINIFDRYKMHRNFRQRMGISLDSEKWLHPSLPSDLTYEEMDESTISDTGTLSYLAHQISQDQQGYEGLYSIQNRVKLEKSVLANERGKFNPTASFVLKLKDEIVGFVTIIDITCWGYERVPWVFDIAVSPKYHGQGFGKQLMLECMARLTDMDYPVIGLAVTVSNENARKLYEKLGYQLVEQFYEFIDLS
ncbi:GNAT family N-acetyltransferase [bacterium]|jgi:ribosomal protein S18 acetylase RimI-like enzyme|nr:GNAT family N-acetyltransferase [bacterium]